MCVVSIKYAELCVHCGSVPGFPVSIKCQCFFSLGLKRSVCNALSTTLGRWIGFLCSRSRLLTDPLLVCFIRLFSLAQSLSALCLEPPVTWGTRKTQLECRSCSAELEATVGGRSREPALRPTLSPWTKLCLLYIGRLSDSLRLLIKYIFKCVTRLLLHPTPQNKKRKEKVKTTFILNCFQVCNRLRIR